MKNLLLEQQVQELHEAGHSIRIIASILDIDKSRVQRTLKKIQEGTQYDDIAEFDTPLSQSETINVFQTEIVSELNETVNSTHFDTDDTSFKLPKKQITDTKASNKSLTFQDLSYSLAETKLLFKQQTLLKEDIHDFIQEMTYLHEGGSSILLYAYQICIRRVKRLIQSTQLLCEKLNEDYYSLFVAQVLYSMLKTMQDVLATGNKYNENSSQVWLDLDRQDIQLWQEVLETDLFTQKFK